MFDLMSRITGGSTAIILRQMLFDPSMQSAASPPMSATTTTPMLLTARAAAKLLSVCEKTLWALTKNGELPVVRIGRGIRYDPQDLSAYINKAKTIGD